MPEQTSNAPILRSGDVINQRYLIREELGSGNFSVVYACVDLERPEKERDAHPLALKILRKEYKSDAYFEKNMLKLLQDKDTDSRAHVCKMYDFFEWRELPIFIMPVHGAPLRSRKLGVGRGVVTRSSVINFAYELLETLRFIHFTCHMVHTDLKPENILIADRATPVNSLGEHWVVCDFGSASQWDMAHLDSDLISTRPYRAPEVVLGTPWFYAADMWSAGCVIFEVAVGNRLFEVRDDNTHLQVMAKRLGPLPELFTVKSRYSPKFFNRRGEVLSPSDLIRSGKVRTTPMREVFQEDPKMLELLTALLTYDPRKRITADKAMMLPIFDRVREHRHRDRSGAPALSAVASTPASSPRPLQTVKTASNASKPFPTENSVASIAAANTNPRATVTSAGAAAAVVSRPVPGASDGTKPSRTVPPVVASESEEEEAENEQSSHTHRPSRSHTTVVTDAPGQANLPAVLPLPASDAVSPSTNQNGYTTSTPNAITASSATPSVLPASKTFSGSAACPSLAASTATPGVSTTVTSTAGPDATATPHAANNHNSKGSAPSVYPVSTSAATIGAAVTVPMMNLATPMAAGKEGTKKNEKDKKRKADAKLASSCSAKVQLNVDNLSTLLVTDEALEEAVQSAEDKRRTSSKHARRSASGYLVTDTTGSSGFEENSVAAVTTPSSTTKDKSTSLPAADSPTAVPLPSNHTAAKMAPTEKGTRVQPPPLSSSEIGGAEVRRPMSAVAVGGTLAPSTIDLIPLTAESIVAPVDAVGAAMTAYETSTQRGSHSRHHTAFNVEGASPRLQRSVSRDHRPTVGPTTSTLTPALASPTSLVPSFTHTAAASAATTATHTQLKKVRRPDTAGSSGGRTPRAQPTARSPCVGSGTTVNAARPTTPRTKSAVPLSTATTGAGGDQTKARAGGSGGGSATGAGANGAGMGGVTVITGSTNHTPHATASHPRTSSNPHSTSAFSKESSTTFEPYAPHSPLTEKSGQGTSADAPAGSHRMHRMPAGLAAKTQRAANYRRIVEVSAAAASSTGGASTHGTIPVVNRTSRTQPSTSATKLVVSRPGSSAAPQTAAAGAKSSATASDRASSKGTRALNSHITRVPLQDEESELEAQSSRASSSRVTSNLGDVTHTVVADNRAFTRALQEVKAPRTTTLTNALSVDELIPVAVTSPFRATRARPSTTSTTTTAQSHSTPPLAITSPASTRHPPAPPPVTAARRMQSSASLETRTPTTLNAASTSPLAGPLTTRPFTAMAYASGGDVPAELSTATPPAVIVRDDTFFLDAPQNWSSQSSGGRPQDGLHPSESPSPGLEPSAGSRPMAVSPHKPVAKATASRVHPAGAMAASTDVALPSRLPQFPFREDGPAPMLVPIATTTSANTQNPCDVSGATSTASLGTAERQMRAMIVKPHGLAVSSSDDDNDGYDHAGYIGAPTRSGAMGQSPHGTVHVPHDVDVQNVSPNSVDRLMDALYGTAKLDSAGLTTNARPIVGAVPASGSSQTPASLAVTVHAMLAPKAAFAHAGANTKPPTLTNLGVRGGGTGSGLPASPNATEPGLMPTRSPRSGRKTERQRASTAMPSETLAPFAPVTTGKAIADARSRRPTHDTADPLLKELLLHSAAPYVVPHTNASVRLPYAANGLTPHAPTNTTGATTPSSYAGTATQPSTTPSRSPFSGLLPPTANATGGSVSRRPLPEAMPARPIRHDGFGSSVVQTTPSTPTFGMGPNISPTSGAGYPG